MITTPSPRHHKDASGVLRHMGGAHRDRPVHPARRAMAMAPTGMVFPRFYLDPIAKLVPQRDQQQEGCCVGASYAEVRDGALARAGLLTSDTQTSMQDAYKVARLQVGTPLDEDSGSTGQDMVDAAQAVGVCSEKLCPFDDTEPSYSAPRTQAQVADGNANELRLDLVCPTIESMKLRIMQGFPLLAGFTCFESLMSAQTAASGLIPFPEAGEKQIGGHEMSAWGWDDGIVIGGYTGGFILRQHWSTDGAWGATYDGVRAYGVLPYQYWLAQLAGDNHSPSLWLKAAS